MSLPTNRNSCRVLGAMLVACMLNGMCQPVQNAAGQDALTVEDLVRQVTTGNAELAFYRAEIEAAKAGRRTAAQWENPELTAELGSKRVWERGGGRSIGDGAAWSVSAAQSFDWPGRIALRKAIADREIELAELGLAQFQQSLASRARRLAYEALATGAQAEAAREVAARFRSLLEVLVQRDSAGVTPLLDQRILEANLLTLNRRATQSSEQQRGTLLQLNQLRGVPTTEPLRVIGIIPVFTNPPVLMRLLEVSSTNNFDIRMRQVELSKQGFQVRLARNERYPRVTLAPFYSSEKGADEERVAGAGLTVPLPLWNQNKGSIAASEARVRQAEASLQVVVRRVEREVVQNALALETRVREMKQWPIDAEREFKDAAELADRHYRLGAVPVTTYLEMQGRYLEALEALLTTRREALDNLAELELLIGQPWPDSPAY